MDVTTLAAGRGCKYGVVMVAVSFPPGTEPEGRAGQRLVLRVYPQSPHMVEEVARQFATAEARHWTGRDGEAVVRRRDDDGTLYMEWVPAGSQGEGAV